MRYSASLCSVLFIVGCGTQVTLQQTENVAPEAVIHSPTHESVFDEGEVIEFSGIVADAGGLDDIQSTTWTSSIDFELGTPELTSPDSEGKTTISTLLSPGTHVITLMVVDQAGLSNSDAVTVTVSAAEQEPTADILSPDNFDSYFLGELIELTGVVTDAQDAGTDLWVSWVAENQTNSTTETLQEGQAASNGSVSYTWVPEDLGNYHLWLTVEDSEGNTGEAELFVIVTDPSDQDLDGDGWSTNNGDCDDDDATSYPGATEVCADNRDNDCNGTIDDKDVDNDGHIDENCVNYVGLLPLDDCNDDDFNTHPDAVEIEDGLDNNCDGETDEGTDAYDNDGDCYCVTAPCTGSISTDCSSLAGDDCDDGDASIYPGASDDPDLGYIDANCDGLDGDITNAVFVDPVSGRDTNSGTTSTSAVQTLDEAYDVASSGSKDWIFVASGDLSLSGSFEEGVSIAGGYDATSSWVRKGSIYPTIDVPASGKTISGWSVSTEWQQIAIVAADATAVGGSSIALRLHSSSGLILNSCDVEAGKANSGSAGSSGSTGNSGKNGVDGDDGVEDSTLACDKNPDPYGGAYGAGGSTCSSYRGGNGGNPGHGSGSGYDGSAGASSGGAKGTGSSTGKDGTNGTNGSSGSTGSSGSGGSAYGTWSTSGYAVSSGTSGSSGTAGRGGGGGGGGGGGDYLCDSWGGGGGGGGGAGCGGSGGSGGNGGGSSVAVLLVGSSIDIRYSVIITGDGGTGGAGGSGGTGGTGGTGGAGGMDEDDSGDGGDGGDGGNGGRGGHGGGGGGGPSIGVVCASSSVLSVDTYTSYSLGTAGTGGSSSGDDGSDGRRANNFGC